MEYNFDPIPGITVEDPSGIPLDVLDTSPFMTGADPYTSFGSPEPIPSDYHSFGPHLPAITQSPPTDYRSFTTMRASPGTPSDISSLWSSAQSSPFGIGDEDLSFSHDNATSIEDIVEQYLVDEVTERLPTSALFGGVQDEQYGVGDSQDPFYQPRQMTEEPTMKPLRVDVNVSYDPDLSAGSSSLYSAQEYANRWLFSIPESQPIQARPRVERHSFSGNDLQTTRPDPSTLLGGSSQMGFRPRAFSAPTTPQYSSSEILPDTFDEDDEDEQTRIITPTMPEASPRVKEEVLEIAKPIVTSDAMKKASEGRRVHTASYVCKICQDTFTTNFSRKRHMNSHTKGVSFPCSYTGCTKTFRNASDRNRHQKKQHPTLSS